MNNNNDNGVTRRDFIKTASAASMATLVAAVAGSGGRCAAGDDVIRVGVIGCGGRGTGAAINAVEAAPGVEIVALYDPFQDRIESSLKTLREKVPAAVKVAPETCFTGFDGYKKLLAIKRINYIVTATPPGFRPHPPRGRHRGRQERLHGEARGRRSGRGPLDHRQLRAGRQEGPGHRRRHPAPAPAELPRDDEAHPRRRHRRSRRRRSATGTRATSGSSSRRRK